MSLDFDYVAHDASWTEALTEAVRKGQVQGFTELANLGAVGVSTIILDDPDGTLGHSGDGITHHQRFRCDDSLATPTRVTELWTMGRRYQHSTSDSLRIGVARKIEVSLEDANTLTGRIPIAPKSIDATVNRPEESIADRIAWILATIYAAGITDTGFVHPTAGTVPANDYSGSSFADVLNECATVSGDNWFIRWDRDAGAWGLFIYNFETYSGDVGTLVLSNDRDVVDSGLDGTWTAGPANAWGVQLGAVLECDPQAYANRLDYYYAKGVEEQTASHSGYPTVGRTASSSSVKTAAIATVKATRYLSDNADEAHRVTCAARIGRESVNTGLVGQLIHASFVEMPDYTALSPFRIARRTPMMIDTSDKFWMVEFQLVPASPETFTYTYAALLYGDTDTTVYPNTLLNFIGTGDFPPHGWTAHPKVGLVNYSTASVEAGKAATGFAVTGDGDIAVGVRSSFNWSYNGSGATARLAIQKNGVTVASTLVTDTHSGPHAFTSNLTIAYAPLITVVSGDIITAHWIWSGGNLAGGTIPIGIPSHDTQYMTMTGYLV